MKMPWQKTKQKGSDKWEVLRRRGQELSEGAGPVIGALEFPCRFENSPGGVGASAQLVRIDAYVASDVTEPSFFKHWKRVFAQRGIENLFSTWTERIQEFCRFSDNVIAIAVPMFVQHQMQTLLPKYKVQVLEEISDIVEQWSENQRVEPNGGEDKALVENAAVTVIVIAGQRPVVLVTHPAQTLNKWEPWLEDMMALMIPQVVDRALTVLSASARLTMLQALRAEIDLWSVRLPSQGERMEGDWIPVFVP